MIPNTEGVERVLEGGVYVMLRNITRHLPLLLSSNFLEHSWSFPLKDVEENSLELFCHESPTPFFPLFYSTNESSSSELESSINPVPRVV